MRESSLLDAGGKQAARGGRRLAGRTGLSSEDSLIGRLRDEFDAPVGLIDPKTSSWVGREGMEDSEFPSPDTCLTAAFSAAVNTTGRAFVWREAKDRGPWWLCIPIALRTGASLFAQVGFADRDEVTLDQVRREPAAAADSGRRRWGVPCPEKALRAWGQAFADELRGEAFPKVAQAANRVEGAERLLVARLIRRMRMSDAPIHFQETALRAVRNTLGFKAAIWIPNNRSEQVCVSGGIEGFEDLEYRSLVPHTMEGTVYLRNDASELGLPDLKRYVVVAAETQSNSGWLLAVNPNDDRPLGATEVELLQPIASLLGSQRLNWKVYHDAKDMLFGIIRALTTAIDAKDPYTKGHSLRVARIAVKLAEALNLPPQHRGEIYLMGLLHDVGKIGIKDDVLKKQGPLDPDEYREIQNHVIIGVGILSDLKKLQHLLPAVKHHHECYDGTGYPSGLKGNDIPLEARIMAVADAYDAMASDRPYRKGLPGFRIDNTFRQGAGKQWDPTVVEAFFKCRHEVADISDAKEGNSLHKAVDGTLNQGSSETSANNFSDSREARRGRDSAEEERGQANP